MSTNPLYGYHGAYLRIDCSTGECERISIAPQILRQYIGGSGLGTWLLTQADGAAIDPYDPAAPLVFVFSPLVGSPLTTSAKFAVVSRSPLTGRINDSLASSHLAIAGKASGCDAIMLVGKAEVPSILVLDNGVSHLQPANDLWGMNIPATQAALKAKLGADFQTAIIGPAGENLVRYATLSHDGRHAGRGGTGAILGAKQIKALAVRGNQRATWANPEGLVSFAKDLSRRSFGPATAKYRELGTAANLLVFNRLHALPTRNFQQGTMEGVEAISPEQMSVAREKTRASCAACTIGCEHLYALHPAGSKDSKESGSGSQQVRMEYENLFALGPLCGITDSQTVLAASGRCDELGLDTISTGGTIAFAMECAERGMLDAPWLRFGDSAALLEAIEQIAARTGLGTQLAEGSRRLAEQLGGDAIDFAPQVKGLELPGYEPRALQTMALGLSVNTRGADHNRSGAYEADFSPNLDRRNPNTASIQMAIATEDRAALIDSLILCKFLRGVFEDLYVSSAEMLQLVTGWDISAEELHITAQRVVNARKAFNEAAGWTPAEDTLPGRMLREALPDDPEARLTGERLREMIKEYNLARGWTADGWLKKS